MVLGSSSINFCISLFPRAEYLDKTAAIKIHTLYDILLEYTESIVMIEGIIHNKAKMKTITTESSITYIFDRAYLDHRVFDRYCKEKESSLYHDLRKMTS